MAAGKEVLAHKDFHATTVAGPEAGPDCPSDGAPGGEALTL
jgi:hypothetical protein